MQRALLCCFLLLVVWPIIPAFAAPRVPVTVATPTRSHWVATTEYLAKVRSFGRLSVTSPVSGWLAAPRLSQGAQVKAGTILGTIKPLGFDARLRAAKSALGLAQTKLVQARRLYKRHDNAAIALDEAQNNYRSAKSRVQALDKELAAYQLRAPAAGTLYYRLPSGAFINDANVTPIVAYVDVSHPLWISVTVPPAQARALKVSQKADLRRANWAGVGKVSSIGDSALASGLVKIIVRPPGGSRLRAGEWIHVALPGKQGVGWRVPRAALVMQGEHSFVYVRRRGRAQSVTVHRQYATDSWAWVSGALDATTQVIVNGADRVTSGTRVHPAPATGSSRA